MGAFDIFESSFVNADETINFGPRAMSDGETNLYETATLAFWKSSESRENQSLEISSYLAASNIVINLNNTTKIINRSTIKEVNVVSWEALVKSSCLDSTEQFLLACLDNGLIKVIDLNANFKTIFEHESERAVQWLNCFITNESEEQVNFIALAKNLIYIIKLDKVQVSVQIEQASECDFLSLDGQRHFIFSSGLYALNVANNQICKESFKCDVKKIFSLNLKYCLILTTRGELLKLCKFTLIASALESEQLYKDIVVNVNKILALTLPDSNGDSFIQLINYPEMSTLFSIKVTAQSHLISSNFLEQGIFFISEVSKFGQPELRLIEIHETDPAKRIQTLIRRKQFDEAAAFAKLFNVNATDVNKAKAQVIIDKIDCTDDEIQTVLDLIKDIDDPLFVLEGCADLIYSCGSFKALDSILTYACGLEILDFDNLALYEFQESFVNYQVRLELFKVLNAVYDRDVWNHFMDCDLLEEVVSSLSKRDIRKACIIYSKLEEINLELSLAAIERILSELEMMDIEEYEPFLFTFIRITLTQSYEAITPIIDWLCQVAINMERTDSFPERAIELVNKIASLNLSEKLLTNSSINNLQTLQRNLSYIKTLKTVCSIKLPLRTFLEGPQSVVEQLITVALKNNSFGTVYSSFLIEFFNDLKLKPDEVLYEAIEAILKKESVLTESMQSCLDCFALEEYKLKAVLIILNSAKMPWSDEVRSIAEKAIQSKHPLVENVKKLINIEPIKRVLRKYKFGFDEIDDIETLELCVRAIIYHSRSSMIEDVYTVSEGGKEFQRLGRTMLIEHFINKGDLETALEIIDKNSPEDIVYICFDCFQYTMIIYKVQNRMTSLCFQTAKGILRHLYNRIIRNTDDGSDLAQAEYMYKAISCAYSLKLHLNITYPIEELSGEKERKALCQKLVEERLTENCWTCEEIIKDCQIVTKCLQLDLEDVLVEYCSRIGNFEILLAAATYFKSCEMSFRTLTFIASVLLKTIGSMQEDDLNNTFSIVTEKPKADLDVRKRGLKLALDMARRAVSLANVDDYMSCVEVMNWMESCEALIQEDRYVYCSYEAIQNLFHIYCRLLENLNLAEYSILSDLDMVHYQMKNLCREQQFSVAFKLTHQLQHTLTYRGDQSHASEKIDLILKNTVIPEYLNASLLAPKFDPNVVSTLLTSYGAEAIDMLKKYLVMFKKNPQKLEDLVKVGIQICARLESESNVKALTITLLTIKWWKKLRPVKMSYDVFLLGPASSRLAKLVRQEEVHFDTVKEYCTDFKLDLEESYLEYLKGVLEGWVPQYQIILEGGTRTLKVDNGQQLLNKCSQIVEAITDKEKIVNELNSILLKVNFYYYEVFLCAMHLLKALDAKDRKRYVFVELVLGLLKKHKRVSAPSKLEKEKWYALFPENPKLDPISEFRLPYVNSLFTNQVWDILKPEINLDTYKTWFSLAKVLNTLNRNNICSYAVHETINSEVFKVNPGVPWVLHEQYSDLFNKIDKCIAQINDLELATSVAYDVLASVPNGADKVKAASLVYKYSKLLHNNTEITINSEGSFSKVKKLHSSLYVMHILYTYKLSDQKYLDLVGQINELIIALYSDERVAKRFHSINPDFPDINEAVSKIAAFLKLDVWKLQKEFVEGYLQGVQMGQKEQDQFNGAAYICVMNDQGDKDFWLRYLSNVNGQSESYQARALKILCLITDEETLYKLTSRNLQENRLYIDKLLLLSDLKLFNFDFDILSLDECNKDNLMSRLKKISLGAESEIIQIMAQLCLVYKIYTVKYWNFILNKCVLLELVDPLKKYLEILKKFFWTRNNPFYIKAWQLVVETTLLKQLGYGLSGSELDRNLIAKIISIQSCNVLNSLNMNKIIDSFEMISKWEFVAVFLQYDNSRSVGKKKEFLKNLTKDLSKEAVENVVQNLCKEGISVFRINDYL